MTEIHALFLEAMKASLEDKTLSWGQEVSPEQMQDVMALAQEHHVLPMIFEAAHACSAMATMDGLLFTRCRQTTLQSVLSQAMKTEEFLALNRHLRSRGVLPLVVKGIVCRNLYPKPDHRHSGDEDVLCGESQFEACHQAMLAFDMEPGAGMESYEVPYRKKGGALYIELHKSLFAYNSDVFSDCNRLFEKAFDRHTEITVNGEQVATLSHTDHMLYLILHAFKHFLHSGFGIRQVCDMILFANAYGGEIDWRYVYDRARGIRAEKFAAALFVIGEKYLVFSPEKAKYPRYWREIKVDEQALLEDLLSGGIYGSSDRSRVHSSNMTLNAVAADKHGKKSRGNLLKTIFPPKRSLEGRYPYLKKMPFLLPIAWGSRILGYAKESVSEPESGAAQVIRTGSKRIELLRVYDIID